MPRRSRLVALVAGGFAVLGAGAGVAIASFSATTTNASNTFAAVPDFVAPTASSVLIQKNAGGTTGYVAQGGSYRVYAAVTDTGNPASGTSSVTANVTNVTTGTTAAAMTTTGGPWTIGSTSYNYRSALLTASNPLAAGSKSFTVTMTDGASNSGSQNGSVTIDNTAPSGSDIKSTNHAGGTVGKMETGDTVVFTTSEALDPNSVKSGWDGTSTSVTVAVANGTNDSFTVTGTNLGTVVIGKSYVSGALNFTNSTMVQSGSTITITLGTPSVPANVGTSNKTGNMTWTPVAGNTDYAGNALPTTTVTESGGAHTEF